MSSSVPPHRARPALVGVVLALLLIACGDADPVAGDDPEPGEGSAVDEPAAPAEAPDEPAEEPPPEERAESPAREEEPAATEPEGPEGPTVAVPALLDFTAPAVGGGTVEGADHAGKPVALWFWAPW